jgi:hypothetical protein
MKLRYKVMLLMVALVGGYASAQQGVTKPQTVSRPSGFRFFNNRLTIKPHVSLTYTYDSNVDADSSEVDDSVFAAKPAVDFEWHGTKWLLVGDVWYRHRYFCQYNEQMGENSFGEALRYMYVSTSQDRTGWTLMLSERYANIDQSDEMNFGGDGRGVWRNRQTFDTAGVVERRFADKWHLSVQGQYSWLDYENDRGSYAPLFGWHQYSVGSQFGYMASKWTDLLVSAGYSLYDQDLSGNLYKTSRNYNDRSESYSLMAGVGTRANERIHYRALMGASWFDYGGGNSTDCGWTYSLSGNWRIHRHLNFTVLGTSYYQPSDQYVGQASKVYTLSGGLSYLTLGDRLNLSLNIAWRFDETCYSDEWYNSSQNYDREIFSTRLAADYLLNRWTSVFAHLIWDSQSTDGYNPYYEYDRVRAVFGVRLHY